MIYGDAPETVTVLRGLKLLPVGRVYTKELSVTAVLLHSGVK